MGSTRVRESTAQTFGVDPNYRVGYVQTWNLKVQRDLPGSLQMVATYLGNQRDTRRAAVSAKYQSCGRDESLSELPGWF